MISVSQAIKNSCKADSNTHTEYIVINNQTIYIQGKLSATAYKDTTFFGTFNMKVLQFETENTTQFRNREFEYYKVIDGNAFKIGNFITTEVVDNDSKETIRVTANDYALKFAIPYVSYLDYNSGQITLFDVLEECCTNAGVQLENESIDNGSFIVDSNQFVNGEMIGDVISAIAGISGNFATITSQNKLRLMFTNDTDEILEDYTDLEDKRDTQPITSVSIGMSQVQGVEAVLKDQQLIDQYGEHWLKINDNPFAYTLEKRQQLVGAIFNKVKGFGYSSFKSEYTYRPYLELGDKIKFKNKDGQLIDSIILRYEFDNENCIFEAPSITSATIDYSLEPTAVDISKRAEVIANQAEASVTSIAYQTIDTSNPNSTASKISKVTQTVDEINSKIQDIADITISGESNFATFTLDNINESEPIMIKVKPVSDYIGYLYPKSTLYPSSNTYLKNRRIRFYNNTTDEIIDYEIPDDLLYYNSSIYDEFYLDYDSQTCEIIKRCGFDANGDIYALANEQIESYPYPTIQLTDGDYTLSLLGYEQGYLFVRLMAKNLYTSQFATRAEVNSSISQSAGQIMSTVEGNYATKNELTTARSQIKQTTDAITLEVNNTKSDVNSISDEVDTISGELELKVSKNDNNQVVSMLNASANQITLNSNRLVIDSSNFKLNSSGNITATGGEIGGFELTNTNFSGSSSITRNYTSTDVDRIRSITRGNITPTENDFERYDLNGDGVIDILDMLRALKVEEGDEPATKSCIYDINSNDPVHCLTITETSGGASNENVSLGLYGGYIKELGVSNLTSTSGIDLRNNPTGDITISLNALDGLIECVRLVQTSKAESKKNFEKLENALDIIKNVDIYKYNYKDEENNTKKHIGFVIGENFNYSEELTSTNNDGAEIYSLASVCLQAIKEQQKEIETLKNEIKKIKEAK